MKKLSICFFLIIIIISGVGCANGQSNPEADNLRKKTDNIGISSTSAAVIQVRGNEATSSDSIITLSPLTEKQALKIANEACAKINTVAWHGYGIDGNIFVEEPRASFNGFWHYPIGSAIDTPDKMSDYLDNSLTEKMQKELLSSLNIVEYNNILYPLWQISGDLIYWQDPSISSLEQNDNSCTVVFKTKSMFHEPEYSFRKAEFSFDKNKGWRVNEIQFCYAMKEDLESQYKGTGNIPTLTTQSAFELIQMGVNKTNEIINSGIEKSTSQFEADSCRYHLMNEEYDTVNKFDEYLRDTFTNDSIETLIKGEGGIKLLGNNLYQFEGGIGNDDDWSRMSLVGIKQTGPVATVSVEVPMFVDEESYLPSEIQFRYIDGAGWRIDIDTSLELY